MSNLEYLFEYLDEIKINNNKDYLVDKVYSKPDDSDIYMVEINKQVFGGAVEFPTMGYKNIEFNIKCINIRGSVTTFFDNGVSFVLFNSPNNIKDVIEYNLKNNKVKMNIVGEPRVQKFGNKETPQIVIKDFEFLDKYDIVDEEPVNDWGIDF